MVCFMKISRQPTGHAYYIIITHKQATAITESVVCMQYVLLTEKQFLRVMKFCLQTSFNPTTNLCPKSSWVCSEPLLSVTLINVKAKQ